MSRWNAASEKCPFDMFYDPLSQTVNLFDAERVSEMSWAIGISEHGILEHPASMPNQCDHDVPLLQKCGKCERPPSRTRWTK